MKIIIIIFLSIGLLLTGCQKNPDVESVISKNSGEFSEAMQEELTEDFVQSINLENLPNKWEDNFEKYNGKLNMTINADIIISDAMHYPVAVIEPYYVPIEQANKIVEAIFGTTDIFFNDTPLTKEQLEEFIIEVEAEQQLAKNDRDDDKVAELQDVIDNLLVELESAPDVVIPKKYDGKYMIDKEDGLEHHHLVLRENPLDKRTPILGIHLIIEDKYGNGYDSSVIYEDLHRIAYNYNDDNINKLPFYEHPVFQTDEANEAIETANKFLEKIGIDDRVIERIVARTSQEESDDITSYLIIYSKTFNDIAIPAYVQFGGSAIGNTVMGEEEYIEPYTLESLHVEVEDNKIVYFNWSNIYNVKEVEKENIRLMSFEEIMSNVESQLSVKYAYLDENNLKYDLYIDKIILTYAVEPIKDSVYEYRLVPVWAFYGGYDFGDGKKLADGTIAKGKHPELASLLTINAVDGTVIFGQ